MCFPLLPPPFNLTDHTRYPIIPTILVSDYNRGRHTKKVNGISISQVQINIMFHLLKYSLQIVCFDDWLLMVWFLAKSYDMQIRDYIMSNVSKGATLQSLQIQQSVGDRA